MTIDLERVKAQYDLDQYIEVVDGLTPEHSNSRTRWYCCPFHSEDTASFVVNVQTQTWRCWGACNCGGDILDYVQMRLFGSIERGKMMRGEHGISESDHQLQAYNVLVGKDTTEFKPRARTQNQEPELKHIPTMDDVMGYRQNREMAVTYFASRGISASEVDMNLVGTQADYSWPYTFKTGDRKGDKVWFHGRRHAMPYMTGTSVRSINKRRDDVWARGVLAMTDPATMRDIRCDMYQRSQELALRQQGYDDTYSDPDEIPEAKLIERCLGPRFHRDGSYPIYGLNSLCDLGDDGEIILVDGRPSLKRMMQCLIVEGEADRMSAEQCGYMAIAAKAGAIIKIGDQTLRDAAVGKYFRAMLNAVKIPTIIADNDNGAGQKYAEEMLRILGRGIILTPPDPFKDLNDLLKAGQLDSWLLSKSIRPQKTHQEVAF